MPTIPMKTYSAKITCCGRFVDAVVHHDVNETYFYALANVEALFNMSSLVKFEQQYYDWDEDENDFLFSDGEYTIEVSRTISKQVGDHDVSCDVIDIKTKKRR